MLFMVTVGHRQTVRLSDRFTPCFLYPGKHLGTTNLQKAKHYGSARDVSTGRRWVQNSSRKFNSVHKHQGHVGKLTQVTVETHLNFKFVVRSQCLSKDGHGKSGGVLFTPIEGCSLPKISYWKLYGKLALEQKEKDGLGKRTSSVEFQLLSRGPASCRHCTPPPHSAFTRPDHPNSANVPTAPLPGIRLLLLSS